MDQNMNKDLIPQRKVILQNQPVSSQKFTIFHLNVWDTDNYLLERMEKILYNIKLYNYDIICLSDVKQDIYDYLKDSLSDYIGFQVYKANQEANGSCIFIKTSNTSSPSSCKIIEPYFYDYDGKTTEHARLIGCEIEIHQRRLHVLTTKLEVKNDVIRNEQFNVIHEVIQPLDDYILTGDFQCKNQEILVNRFNNENFIDCYIEMGCPNKLKYTLSKKNPNNVNLSESIRPDRIFYHSTFLKLKSMSLECLENCPKLNFPPSQHYGLSCEFNLNTE